MNSLVEKLETRPDTVILLIGAYFLLNLMVRILLPNSLEIDEAGQILMSQWYAFGYDTQPPFFNWVQHLVIDGIGQSLFALSLVKNVFLFLSYVFYYLAARQVLTGKGFAVAAALGLLTLPEIGWLAQRDLTHSNASLLAACLFLYGLFRTLDRPTITSYLVTGVAIGIGLISKYNFSILCFCAFVAVLADPAYRQRIFDWRILVTAAVAIAIVSPHALWLFQNFEIASHDTLEKLETGGQDGALIQIARGLSELPLTLLSFCALTVLVYACVARGRFWPALRAGTPKTRLVEIMFGALLIFLLLLIFFAGTAELKNRWVSPVLFILPFYLCMKLDAYGVDQRDFLKRFVPVVLLLMVLIPASLVLRIVAAGPMNTHPKLTVPYQDFIENIVKTPAATPALVIAEDAFLAGNIRMQLPDTPVDTQTYRLYSPPFDWSAENPILLVWRANGEDGASVPTRLEDRLKQRIGSVPPLQPQTIALPYIYGSDGDLFRFGYAWVRKP
ncbi:glycosyltransferase family 39 protein [Pararhizobium sp. BT-229]|uniref:glycosyltransferase family 39 protein n=1 Tax=Pararhizobium sp. BT-229 TaxID=2986923 RepID=UPI0021F7E831|nr:glycosyltransferase family 39 protein [Pararhizobium sp. BT-229]MCV9963498.1 glycosyltransferase family 39 protein [Pararhizobium sp. BT-229]